MQCCFTTFAILHTHRASRSLFPRQATSFPIFGLFVALQSLDGLHISPILSPCERLTNDTVVLTKHTRYFHRPRPLVSHSTLHSYSKLPPRLPRHDRARRALALRGQTRIRVRYRKRTSGTCWTMTKQLPPNSPSNHHYDISPYPFPHFHPATSLSICSSICARLYHTFFSPHPIRNAICPESTS
jgi:hypothetical protein